MPKAKAKPKPEPKQEVATVEKHAPVEAQKYDVAWWNPTTFPEAMEMANVMAKTNMVPNTFKGKPAEIVVAWQYGASLGLNILSSLQNISVINGVPSVWGDAPLAICKKHPDWVDIDEKFAGEEGADDYRAICIVKRRGQTDCNRVFSVKDSKRAGLWGKNVWANYPKRMLQMRARSWALRDTFPDALKGMGIGEEERDKNITDQVTVRDAEPEGATATERLKNKMKPKVEVTEEPPPDVDKEHGRIHPPQEEEGVTEEEVEELQKEDPEKTVEDYIAEARTSEDLSRLLAEINHRHDEKKIDTERWGELAELVQAKSKAIATGGKKGKKKK